MLLCYLFAVIKLFPFGEMLKTNKILNHKKT